MHSPPCCRFGNSGGLPHNMISALANRRILIVDDVPAFLHELRSCLKGHCGEVAICTSPLRALRQVRREPPDLLITTLVMKELGGFEVIRRVRGLGSPIPIVMITGRGNEKTAIEATRLGVSDYLEKPVSAEELRARLGKIFAAQRQPAAAPERAAPVPSPHLFESSAGRPRVRAVHGVGARSAP